MLDKYTGGKDWAIARATETGTFTLVLGGDNAIVADTYCCWRGKAVTESNAQRICDCVNGCRGYNPEAIKEVVEALEDLMEALEEHGSTHNDIRVAYNLAKPTLANIKEEK